TNATKARKSKPRARSKASRRSSCKGNLFAAAMYVIETITTMTRMICAMPVTIVEIHGRSRLAPALVSADAVGCRKHESHEIARRPNAKMSQRKSKVQDGQQHREQEPVQPEQSPSGRYLGLGSGCVTFGVAEIAEMRSRRGQS